MVALIIILVLACYLLFVLLIGFLGTYLGWYEDTIYLLAVFAPVGIVIVCMASVARLGMTWNEERDRRGL